jgi:hypothetical protein
VKAIRALRTDTREGFRLLVAWVIGVLSFGVLSSLAERVVLYAQPWKAENTAHSEAELILLLFLLGLGVFALAGALIFEGVRPKQF